MAGRTAWILGNRLSHENPALEGADRVLLVESRAGLTAKRYHRQKLHLILSAMRHFTAELRDPDEVVETILGAVRDEKREVAFDLRARSLVVN